MSMETQKRYSRQVHPYMLSEEEQRQLENAKVTICGCGGLGSPVAYYLAAAGVGTIHLFDHEVVEESNLNRQILYTEDDVGKLKVMVATKRLASLNSMILIVPHAVDITVSPDFPKALKDSDVVVDCLDSFAVRRFVSRQANAASLPIVHGGLFGWQGELAIFLPGEEPSLASVLEGRADDSNIPVLGPVAGIVGCAQALEVIKLLLCQPTVDPAKFHMFDGQEGTWFSYSK